MCHSAHAWFVSTCSCLVLVESPMMVGGWVGGWVAKGRWRGNWVDVRMCGSGGMGPSTRLASRALAITHASTDPPNSFLPSQTTRPPPCQAIAPLVPNYLMGIAAGAGVMGLYMVVCGFFQPLDSLPNVMSPRRSCGEWEAGGRLQGDEQAQARRRRPAGTAGRHACIGCGIHQVAPEH